MKVFVLHARRTGYGVIRSLRSFRPQIYVADIVRTPVFHSRYVTKRYLVSDLHAVGSDAFLGEMVALAEDMAYWEEKPIVFTGRDDYLLFFSKNYPVLSQYYDYSFESDYDILEAALNKKRLVRYALEAGVDIPRSYTDDDPLEDILKRISWPVIIKPAIKSRPDRNVEREAFRLQVCRNEPELTAAVSLLTRIGQPYVIQEYIPGGDGELYTVGTYSWKGEIKAWSVSKKIRQFPPATGECALGVTLHEPTLAEPAARLLKRIGLTGISQIEFKKHDGRYYLIEINPRIWSWHQISAEVGVNLDKIAIDHLRGAAHDGVVQPAPQARYWMFLTMDLLHNRILHRNVSLLRLLGDLVRSRVEAFWDYRDPQVFAWHLRETVGYMRAVVAEHRQGSAR